MALSTCPKCDSHLFEITQNTPSGSEVMLNFVQCSKCGAVVGVMDFLDIGQLICKLADKLNVPLDR